MVAQHVLEIWHPNRTATHKNARVCKVLGLFLFFYIIILFYLQTKMLCYAIAYLTSKLKTNRVILNDK